MSEMLTRQVQDNRLLRMGGQLAVSTGAAARAAFDTPMMGGLLAQGFQLAGAAQEKWTPEQFLEHAEAERARLDEGSRLRRELQYITDQGERDRIFGRLRELQEETEMAFDAATRESIEEGRMAAPDELAEQYGDLGLTFDRPMAVAEARLLAENKREEIVRNSIIQAGPQGVIPTMARFAAGFAAMATDPLEVATMFIPVVTPARMAVLTTRLGRVGGRVAAGAIEGLVGSAVTEPFYYGMSRSQQLDYTMADALFNVGVGTLLGGGIGAISSAVARADLPERIDPSITKQSGEIALRQFALGQGVNVQRLLDGTDLRGTTTLSRTGGIEFQATRTVDFPPERRIDTRPTVLMQAQDGNVRVFDTAQKADAEAELVGGKSIASPDGEGYAARHPVEGDLIRDPFGKPVTFKTEHAASKFVENSRLLDAADNRVVPTSLDGRKVWVVTRDMPSHDVAALARAGDNVSVPDGVNTRASAVLPDADARMDQAVRGVVADALTGKRFAQDVQNIRMDPVADVDASARAEVISRETIAPDDIDGMDAIVRQMEEAGELTGDMRAQLDEIRDIEARATAYERATDAGVACIARGA